MMKQQQIFAIFVRCISIVSCTRHIPSVEISYFQNVCRNQDYVHGLPCPSTSELMRSWCHKLFFRPHYRYEVKVHLNQFAYSKGIASCVSRPVTFASNHEILPKDRLENVFVCFGRHLPGRTSLMEDDFFEEFYLAHTKSIDRFYVFRRERQGVDDRYKLYEEILDMANQIPNHEMLEYNEHQEKILYTIETSNPWPHEIENIFVREMIHDQTPTVDQLAEYQSCELIHICISLFHDESFGHKQISIDLNQMQNWNGMAGNINLYFDHEPGYSGFVQEKTYPCYGMHSSNEPLKNQQYLKMFRISSGRRKNSIFIYNYLSYENNSYMIEDFIENIDFTGLTPVTTPPAA